MSPTVQLTPGLLLRTRAVPPRLLATKPAVPPWAGLLGRCYARAGLPLPRLTRLSGAEMPEPYRLLLVHSRDMTPTLEAYYATRLGVKVLSRQCTGNAYLREVLLLRTSGAPVEYGIIRIHLERLPQLARRAVLAEQAPFGSILQREGIPHLSWPQAFFRLEADLHIGHALGLSRPEGLYGRRNVLLDGARRLLAEVIEVLPSVPPGEPESPPSAPLSHPCIP